MSSEAWFLSTGTLQSRQMNKANMNVCIRYNENIWKEDFPEKMTFELKLER